MNDYERMQQILNKMKDIAKKSGLVILISKEVKHMPNVVKYHPKKLQIKSEDFVMPFGNYKHRTIEYILDVNPGYIVWLKEENIADIKQKIYNKAQELDRHPDYGDGYYPDGFDEYLYDDPPY